VRRCAFETLFSDPFPYPVREKRTRCRGGRWTGWSRRHGPRRAASPRRALERVVLVAGPRLLCVRRVPIRSARVFPVTPRLQKWRRQQPRHTSPKELESIHSKKHINAKKFKTLLSVRLWLLLRKKDSACEREDKRASHLR
jgi:hypothetical protein